MLKVTSRNELPSPSAAGLGLSVRRIGMADLAQVVEIEREVFESVHRIGLAKHRELMAVPAIKGRNMSAGAFAGGRMVGYVLAYPRESFFVPGQAVSCIYYLGILRPYRLAAVGPLLEVATGLAKLYGFPAVEMLCTPRLFERLSKAERTIAILGGAISASKPVSGVSGEPQIAARVDPPLVAYPRSFRLRAAWVRRADTARALPRRCVRRACLLLPRGVAPRRCLGWGYLYSAG